MQEFQILQPDDWHLHLRDGAALALTVNATARVFRRAIVMPNLKPPVTSTAEALAYRARILAALDPAVSRDFEPLMTLYLTDNTPPAEIARARESGCVHAVKLYPAGATTNSDAGVTDLGRCRPVLAAMERLGMPLLVHGEVTGPDTDVFDREKVFIDHRARAAARRLPGAQGGVRAHHHRRGGGLRRGRTGHSRGHHHAAPPALQPQHMLAGAIRPHFFCLPVLKRNTHQRALIRAATGGSPRFFLGTDSAPHARGTKECASGCAGIYSAHAALESYAAVFEAEGALARLEAFASLYGADFYGLPRNTRRIRLRREPWQAPQGFGFGEDTLVPMCAGETIAWRVSAAEA